MSQHHQQHDHSHPHEHGSDHALLWPLLLILGFAVVEALGGWFTGSLALLGDAGHMFSDAAALGLAWLGVFGLLQVLRLWVLATLKSRWTTRIIVLPGARLVAAGPYRFLSHPNYVVVVGEIAVLPLVFDLGWFALLFSALNGVVLFVRIRAENAALGRVPHG